jgi:hypothetical protein
MTPEYKELFLKARHVVNTYSNILEGDDRSNDIFIKAINELKSYIIANAPPPTALNKPPPPPRPKLNK